MNGTWSVKLFAANKLNNAEMANSPLTVYAKKYGFWLNVKF